jgi:tetratricopeptide (TPR) repeat protein
MKLLLACCLPALCAFAGSDYSQDYAELKQKVAADKMDAHLADWRKSQPENPDAWILSANWFFEQAQSESISITNKLAGKGDFAVTDPKTGKQAGSISTGSRSDPEKMKAATEALREALTRWPQRLDIHCGLAHMFETSDAWSAELATLRALAVATREHAGKLRWCHDEPLDAPDAAFVAGKLHSYALHQFEKESPETDARFHQVAQLIVATFPDSAIGHNDLAVFHGVTKNWREAQKALEAAAKVAPDDALVWANIGDNSLRLGDPKRARSAYEKVITLDSDPRMAAHAKAALAKLSGGKSGKKK